MDLQEESVSLLVSVMIPDFCLVLHVLLLCEVTSIMDLFACFFSWM